MKNKILPVGTAGFLILACLPALVPAGALPLLGEAEPFGEETVLLAEKISRGCGQSIILRWASWRSPYI